VCEELYVKLMDIGLNLNVTTQRTKNQDTKNQRIKAKENQEEKRKKTKK